MIAALSCALGRLLELDKQGRGSTGDQKQREEEEQANRYDIFKSQSDAESVGDLAASLYQMIPELFTMQLFSPEACGIAIYYLLQIQHTPAARWLFRRSCVCKVVAMALLLAAKWFDDHSETNSKWAQRTQIPLAEINSMEYHLLVLLDWSLWVNTADYNTLLCHLLEPIYHRGCLGHARIFQQLGLHTLPAGKKATGFFIRINMEETTTQQNKKNTKNEKKDNKGGLEEWEAALVCDEQFDDQETYNIIKKRRKLTT